MNIENPNNESSQINEMEKEHEYIEKYVYYSKGKIDINELKSIISKNKFNDKNIRKVINAQIKFEEEEKSTNKDNNKSNSFLYKFYFNKIHSYKSLYGTKIKIYTQQKNDYCILGENIREKINKYKNYITNNNIHIKYNQNLKITSFSIFIKKSKNGNLKINLEIEINFNIINKNNFNKNNNHTINYFPKFYYCPSFYNKNYFYSILQYRQNLLKNSNNSKNNSSNCNSLIINPFVFPLNFYPLTPFYFNLDLYNKKC